MDLTGTLALTGTVPCEDADQGEGSVSSVAVSHPNLSFAHDGTGSFVRAGPAVSTAVQGLCTFRSLQYHCEMALTGTWNPVVDLDRPDAIATAELAATMVTIRAI